MKCLFLPCLLVLAWPSTRAAANPMDGDAMAAHMDGIRRPAKSFEVVITLTEWRDGKKDKTGVFHVYARKVAGYPDFDTLAYCMAPAGDKGKVLLTKGTEAWLLDPKSERPVSLSYEKVRSQFFVAYGLTASFVREYQAAYAGEETVQDAARRDRACYHYELRQREGMTKAPGKLHYWLDKESLRPVKGQIMTSGGKLLRTVYYTRFKKVLGRERPTRLPVVSGEERGLVTDIEFSNLAYRDLPAPMFTPEGMAGFRPE
jgi:outer membrane lipoprotein-sorting protein